MSLLATTVPIVPIYRGDDTDFPEYSFNQGSIVGGVLVPGAAIDLSVYAWSAQWRTSDSAPDYLDLVIDLSEAVDGTIYISAPGETTAAMTGSGYWDLQSIKDGEVRTWIKGRTILTKDVTHG